MRGFTTPASEFSLAGGGGRELWVSLRKGGELGPHRQTLAGTGSVTNPKGAPS